MPSELDDLVLSQGPANRPQGLTFDDVPMRWNDPSDVLLRHGGFRPLVERLASVEPTAAAMRRYDPTWHDELAALLTSDPRLASTRVKPGSIPRSSALGPWSLFAGPDNPDRPSYMMEPTLPEQQEGGILRERLPKETYSDENGVVRHRDTGQPVPIVKRPGLLPLVGTPEGVKVALPRLIDLMTQGGGAAAVLPPKAIRVGSHAASARATRPLVNDVLDRSAAEAQAATDKRIAQELPAAANDNAMPGQLDLRPPDAQPSSASSRNTVSRQSSLHPSDVRPAPASNNNMPPRERYFDPPKVRRRFEEDYPNAPVSNVVGDLVQDMDKELLSRPGVVIGRKTLRGPDQPLIERDFNALGDLLTNKRKGIREVEQHEMKQPGSVVESDLDEYGVPIEIRVLRTLSPEDKVAAKTREFAKAIVAWVRPWREYRFRPVERMEMRRVYNELGNPKRIEGRPDKDATPFTPAERGYSADDESLEYLAEAARGYLTEPGWLKSVAPNTAKTLRQIAREHPWLQQFLILNGLAPMMFGGAGISAAAFRDARDPRTDKRDGG